MTAIATGTTIRPLVAAGLFLGVGLGGFVDGIVLHQLLQWHHMLTAHGDYPMDTVRGLEVNTTWDGVFHAATWLATVAGLALLWNASRLYDVTWTAVLVGAILIGWGGFNIVEGIVNHHLLTLHHVRDDKGGPLAWDLAFLAWGAVFLSTGWGLVARRRRDLQDEAAETGAPRRAPHRM